uniref:Sphingomyelin phosphodiesterase C-terminal domain-containing protein n=1 Tax=Anopheles maculatus TaxID=74869 RepID=A0A182SC93_9DIPT
MSEKRDRFRSSCEQQPGMKANVPHAKGKDLRYNLAFESSIRQSSVCFQRLRPGPGSTGWKREIISILPVSCPVYIVGHIPPGSDERHIGHTIPFGHSSFTEKNNVRYLRLVKRYSSIIQGQFFGHLHSDSFRVVYNEVGKPVSWMMIAPSISPRRSSESNNPAMRLYKFDTDTGQVLDYTQYYLDLEQANKLEEAVWQPEYNLTTYYYGLSEVSSLALHNLADRFNNADDAQFMKYYRANSVRHATSTCEGVCLLNHYCAITRLDYREFRSCLETAAKAMASKNGSPGGLFVSTLAFNRLLMAIAPALLMVVLSAWSCSWSVDTVRTTYGDLPIGALYSSAYIASCWHTVTGWMMAIGHGIRMVPVAVWITVWNASAVLLFE